MKSLSQMLMSMIFFSAALSLSGCSTNSATPSTSGPSKTQGETQSPHAPRSTGGQSAGAVQNVRQAAKRVGDGNELRQFAHAYTAYALEFGRGPSRVQDIQGSLTPKMVKAFDADGDYEVNWRLQNPSSDSILAYAKDGDVYGTRLVAKGDGSVVRMSKEEFEQARSRR